MKKLVGNLLKIVLPLGLGIGLIFYYVNAFSEEQIDEIYQAFLKADYGWIIFSLVFAVLSHLSRAYRWKYTLRPLGYHPKFLNNFYAVMIAYLVNLAIPRLGEFTRCGVMARYENIPYEKLLGTVIAERIADLIIMMIFSVLVLYFQFHVIDDYVTSKIQEFNLPVSFQTLVLIGFGLMLIGSVTLYVLFKKAEQFPILLKVKGFLVGLLEGIQSIWKMKDKWAFLGHTVFIWGMYVLMFYVCFFSLPETLEVPFEGILTGFILGGFTVILTNGGIGAYPAVVGLVLGLYGVNETTGYAFGTIVWAAQTLLLLIFGAASFALMPIYNKRRAQDVVEAT